MTWPGWEEVLPLVVGAVTLFAVLGLALTSRLRSFSAFPWGGDRPPPRVKKCFRLSGSLGSCPDGRSVSPMARYCPP